MSKNVTSAAVDVFLGDYLYQRFFIADTVGHNASLLGPLLKAILRNQLAATVMRNDPLEPVPSTDRAHDQADSLGRELTGGARFGCLRLRPGLIAEFATDDALPDFATCDSVTGYWLWYRSERWERCCIERYPVRLGQPVAVKIYDAQDVDNLPSCFDPSADGPKVHEITW